MAKSVDHPFAIVPARMLSEVKPSAVVVYAVLAEHANADQECWPSVGRIAKRSNLSLATVRSACKELVEAGWLTMRGRATDEGRQTSNLYFVHRVKGSGTPQKARGSPAKKSDRHPLKNEGRTRPNEPDRSKQQRGIEPSYLTASETREMLDENQPDKPTSNPSADVRRVRAALDASVRVDPTERN